MGVLSITSLYYLIFLFLGIIIYYALPARQWICLAVFSAVFYLLAGSVKSLVWLFANLLVTYVGAILIEKCQISENCGKSESCEQNEKYETEKKKKAILVWVIIITVLQLVLLKYLTFFDNLGLSVKTEFRQSLVAPLAISFYSLSILGYVLDVYWGTAKAQKNLFKHFLFMCYMPQMISGPVTRYDEMNVQFFEQHEFNYELIKKSFMRILWGFFKKCVIADQVAIMVNTIFNDTITYQGFYVIVGAVLFALQLYTDFSGCMDIVIGSSGCFGIILPENFNRPFASTTMSEFWRRWHITLGVWFKDYILYPLLKSGGFQKLMDLSKKKFGKKKGKKVPTYLGLFILWFLIGFWHGGAIHFIIGSGVLHWFYIVVGELLEPVFKDFYKKHEIDKDKGSFLYLRRAKVFVLVCSGFLFFRSDTCFQAVKMAYRMIVPSSEHPFDLIRVLDLGLSFTSIVWLVIAFVILVAFSVLQGLLETQSKTVFEWVCNQKGVLQYGICILIATMVILAMMAGYGADVSNFIYNQF